VHYKRVFKNINADIQELNISTSQNNDVKSKKIIFLYVFLTLFMKHELEIRLQSADIQHIAQLPENQICAMWVNVSQILYRSFRQGFDSSTQWQDSLSTFLRNSNPSIKSVNQLQDCQ
jgi:hypothetical protein